MPSANNIRIAKNTMYMYLRMFVILLVSLYTTRIVFNVLGVQDYGIYGVVGGIIVFFTFINNSLTGATQRYITAELAEGDLDSQREVFSTAIVSHLLIGLVIVVLGETIGLWFLNAVMNIPPERMGAANIVYQLSILSTFFSVLQAPFNATIIAHEKMSVYAYFSIFDVLFKLGVAFLIRAISGDKLILYAFLIFAIGLLNIVIYRIYCYRTFQMCRFHRPRNRNTFKGLFSYTGWALFGTATYVGTNQGVTMLVNFYNGVIVNAAMGVSNQIVSVVNQFVTNFQAAFRPQIVKYYVTRDSAELSKLTIRASRLSAYLILVLLVPVCFEIKDFLGIWLGDYPPYAVEFCVLTLVCIYFESICNPLIALITSDKDIRNYQITVSLLYSTNLIFCWIVLSQSAVPYLVIAVRLAIDMALVVSRLLLMRKKWYDFPIMEWVKEVIAKPLLVTAIPVSLSFLLHLIPIGSVWVRLFLFSGLSLLICVASIYSLLLEKEEKSFLLQQLSRFNPIPGLRRLFYDASRLGGPEKKIFVYGYIGRKGLDYDHDNWGDDINVGMIEEISDLKVLVVNRSLLYRIVARKTYCCIGSTLGMYKGRRMSVWGSGFISENSRMKVVPEKVYSVRGPLTRQKLLAQGIECPAVYGDPALLVSRYYRPGATKKYKYGIIPHYTDEENVVIRAFGSRDDVCIIRMSGYRHWHDIPDAVCACERIVSSSLHGLIVADSYGIPNVWIRLSDNIHGGNFKYLDYFQSVGRDIREPVVVGDVTKMDEVLACESLFTCAEDIDFDAIVEACPFKQHLL